MPAVPDDNWVHRFAVKSNHGARYAGSCEELAKTKGQTPVEEFCGLCTYYRRFISGFADRAKPLTRLTEEIRTFEWFTEAEKAFQAMKTALCTAPVLGYTQAGEKFIIDTDARNIGIGGVLSQVQDSSERIVSCESKILPNAERNYCVTHRNLVAIVKTLEHTSFCKDMSFTYALTTLPWPAC